MTVSLQWIQQLVLLLLPLALLESGVHYWRKRRAGEAYPLRENVANFGVNIIGRGIRYFLTGTALAVWLQAVSTHAFWQLPKNGWMFLLSLLLADFVYYWNHRLGHRVRVMWAIHSVHHSSNVYNLSTALRLPWFGASIGGLFFIPAVLIGLDPITLVACKSLVLLGQFWIHTEHINTLGWFDRFFNSPSNHRVHHGSNPQYIDKNYAGILMVWDHLFGTYEPEVEKVRYGLTAPMHTINPLKINFSEFWALLREAWAGRGWRQKLWAVIRPPEAESFSVRAVAD